MGGFSHPNGGNQARNADKGDGSFDIVGERRQAELPSHVFQPAHQERALIHPLLDRSERVLDAFAPLVQNVGPGGKTHCHAVKHRLILKTRHATEAFGAAFAKAARLASVAVDVVDLHIVAGLAKVTG